MKPAGGRSNESDPVAGSPGHWWLAKGAGSVAGVMMAGPVPLLGLALIHSLLILTGDGSNGKISWPQVEFSFPRGTATAGPVSGRFPASLVCGARGQTSGRLQPGGSVCEGVAGRCGCLPGARGNTLF